MTPVPDLGAHRELRQALADATEGPWEVEEPGWGPRVVGPSPADLDGSPVLIADGIWESADAAFIAAARNHLPALLDRLDAAETEAARYREAVEGAVRGWSCSHCGYHPKSDGGWCAAGCGRDHGVMTEVVVLPARAALRPAAHQDSDQ